MPSHHTPPSLVVATLVNTVFLDIVSMANGLVLRDVPGATPKNPASGLMARNWPAPSKSVFIENKFCTNHFQQFQVFECSQKEKANEQEIKKMNNFFKLLET